MQEVQSYNENIVLFFRPQKLGVLFSLHQCVRAQCSFRFTSASSPTRSLTFGRWGCGEHDHLNHTVSRRKPTASPDDNQKSILRPLERAQARFFVSGASGLPWPRLTRQRASHRVTGELFFRSACGKI